MHRLSVATILLLCVSAVHAEEPKTSEPKTSLADARLAAAVFSGRLYEVLSKESPQENLVVSPYGVFESLAMLEPGSRDGSQAELRKLIGSGGLSLAEALTQIRLSGLPITYVLDTPIIDNNRYGVRIAQDPANGSATARAGLHKGDLIFTVNDDPVRSVDEFNNAIARGGARATLAGYDFSKGVPYDRTLTIAPVPRNGLPRDEHPILFSRAIWLDSNLIDKTSYVADVRPAFDLKLFPLNIGDRRVKDRLNAEAREWFANDTSGRITDVSFQNLPENLRMLIVNVLAMNANWDRVFNETWTRPGEFEAPKGPVNVNYMKGGFALPVAEFDDFQVLDLPYEDCGLKMRIYLPRKSEGLTALESRLAKPVGLESRIVGAMQIHNVDIQLPKFRVESQLTLKQTLNSLGLIESFENSANFSGIDPSNQIKMVDVRQKVFVEIDEHGTRAGSVTSIPLRSKGIVLDPRKFHATHPFLFDIRDSAGTVFLMGRVMQPLAAPGGAATNPSPRKR